MEALESRLTPSGSPIASVCLDCPTKGSAIPAPPPAFPPPGAGQRQASPDAVINFANLRTQGGAYTLYVRLEARDGTVFDKNWQILPPADRTTIRNLVLDAMRTEGWDGEPLGDFQIKIVTHGPRQLRSSSPIRRVGAVAEGAKQNEQPGITASSGVQRGQLTEGGKWKFSFRSVAPGGTIGDDALVQATIDGTVISATVTAGMTPEQAAAALYQALVDAGIADAELVGSDILFLGNTNGEETLQVSLTYTSLGNAPDADWLRLEVEIPERLIDGSPASGSGR